MSELKNMLQKRQRREPEVNHIKKILNRILDRAVLVASRGGREEVGVCLGKADATEEMRSYILDAVAGEGPAHNFNEAMSWLKAKAGVPVTVSNTQLPATLFIFGREEDEPVHLVGAPVMDNPGPRILMLPAPSPEDTLLFR